MEEVEAAGHAVAQEIGLGERQVDAARTLAERRRSTHELAATKEVGLGDRDFADDAVLSRITARDAERAGGLIFNVNHNDNAVRRGARLVGDADALEEPKIVQPTLGAIHQYAVIGVAFAKIELATDHVVTRAGVAANGNALDVNARTLFDDEGERNSLRRRITLTTRTRSREGVTLARDFARQRFNRTLDEIAVVDIASGDFQRAAQSLRRHVRET